MQQEIAHVAQKQDAEADRQRGKRARRRREVKENPSDQRSRQARKGVEKERYKQTGNFRAGKRGQKARAKARKRKASRQPGEVGLELLAEKVEQLKRRTSLLKPRMCQFVLVPVFWRFLVLFAPFFARVSF